MGYDLRSIQGASDQYLEFRAKKMGNCTAILQPLAFSTCDVYNLRRIECILKW